MTTSAPMTRDTLAALSHTPARQLLRRLAERPPRDLPVLSLSIDRRPEIMAVAPEDRSPTRLVQRRGREINESFHEHTAAHRSVTADRQRIEELIHGLPANVEGLLVWACSGDGLWETFETWYPLETSISTARLPKLIQLARVADHEPALVAEADTNTLRLFLIENGEATELPGYDQDHHDFTRDDAEEWNERRIQAHQDEHRAAFAREAATHVHAAIKSHDARRVLLAGDEVAVPLLKSHLPAASLGRVRETLHLPIVAGPRDVLDAALPVLERLEAEDATDAADRMLGAARATGLGVVGIEPVRQALTRGQGLELLLDAGGSVPVETADELIRLAATTDAAITFVPDHQELMHEGGAGALLRFRII